MLLYELGCHKDGQVAEILSYDKRTIAAGLALAKNSTHKKYQASEQLGKDIYKGG